MTRTDVVLDAGLTELAVGLVEVSGLTIGPSDANLVQQCRRRVARVVSDGPDGGEPRRQAVRSLLRAGGFKPSGRNKPAQEYLLRTAGQEALWPAILNAVDVLNVVSLESGLPISLVALDRLGSQLLIRYGAAGESFVFNQTGQVLDVAGLICICQGDMNLSRPVGSPVKDSLEAKVTPTDRQVLACIYAPQSAITVERLQHWTDELAADLQRWCGTSDIQTKVLPASWAK